MSPLLMLLMIRALGPGGYGRWWSAFVVLEAAGYLGMFASDLWVRREVARLTHEGKDAEIPAVVGSALAVVLGCGLTVLGVQIVIAYPIAAAQDDPGLVPYLLILGCQPLLVNIAGVFGGALQSRDILGAIAVFRGIVFPLLTAALLFLAWRFDLSPETALVFMVSVTGLGCTTAIVLYGLHLPLGASLRAMLAPVHAKAVLRYGSRLMIPIALFVIGGKLDLYVLGAHVDAVLVGVYGGCLQVTSGLPNIRGLLDPVIQTQVGALYGAEPAALSASLQRLTRLCMFALAPAFVLLIAIGTPVLSWLLGFPVPYASTPLIILVASQLIGQIAVASWVVPMMMSGRVLGAIAAATLGVKLVLLLALVPGYGLIGAAIATAAGTIISMQGQALVGAHRLRYRPYATNLVPMLLIALGTAIGGRVLYETLAGTLEPVVAVVVAGGVTLVVLVALMLAILTAEERSSLRKLLRV